MKNITVNDILTITDGKLIGTVQEDKKLELLDYSIKDMVVDSRKAEEHALFVAIPGENVDAHKFVPQVADKTKAVLVEQDEEAIKSKAGVDALPEDIAYIYVENTLDALQKIGGFVRSQYSGKVIGVTGSVGKTTTREMITTALRSNAPTFSTDGNMNSQIGVALTLSHIMDQPTDYAVIEMGISEPGGMDKLTAMAKPDMAAVTIIGSAHIEFLKSKEGIREEKLRITGRMDENGVAFLNADDPLLFAIKDSLPVKTFTYGTRPDADYVAENIRFENGFNSYTFVHGDKRVVVNLSALGKHNVLNSLVAMAISEHLGLDLSKAAESFEHFQGLRQKIIGAEKGFTIIDDSYNASSDSMKAAINVLKDISVTGRRVAVLGDMFELGPDSALFHKEVGEYINTLRLGDGKPALDLLVTIGEISKNISDAVSCIPAVHFTDRAEAVKYIREYLESGDVITFKASNGMKFWELIEEIK